MLMSLELLVYGNALAVISKQAYVTYRLYLPPLVLEVEDHILPFSCRPSPYNPSTFRPSILLVTVSESDSKEEEGQELSAQMRLVRYERTKTGTDADGKLMGKTRHVWVAPPCTKQYPISLACIIGVLPIVQQLEQLVKTHSPSNSPIWAVKKPDGYWRLTVDYRKAYQCDGVIYLGQKISSGKHEITQDRISAIRSVKEPTTVRDLRSFLGLFLGIPDNGRPFTLHVHEQDDHMKAVLTQEHGDSQHPIGHCSARLDPMSLGWGSCLQAMEDERGEEGQRREHVCIEILQQLDEAARASAGPLQNPDPIFFINGSSFVENGIHRA
eukprot:g45663.t1